MVQIAGSYKLVENKNFYEFSKAIGVPEDRAKESNKVQGTLTVSIDGKKLKMANDTPEYVTDLVIDEEVEEKMPRDMILKSTAKLDENVITISMKTKDGDAAGTRVFTFSDSGLKTVISVPKDGKTISATRIYKRI